MLNVVKQGKVVIIDGIVGLAQTQVRLREKRINCDGLSKLVNRVSMHTLRGEG
jgi:hypothetical protein